MDTLDGKPTLGCAPFFSPEWTVSHIVFERVAWFGEPGIAKIGTTTVKFLRRGLFRFVLADMTSTANCLCADNLRIRLRGN